jgi:hypothetical protein
MKDTRKTDLLIDSSLTFYTHPQLDHSAIVAMAPSAVSAEAMPTPQAKQLAPRSEDQTKEKTALQAISQGVCLPGIPLFSDYDKHRAWMLSHMAGAFRVFARKGYTEGMSGHIW